MPLDTHSYLVAQGWSGKGSGLRHGAISRPLAIPQKKTLAGLGRDRDEAFPFWDHLFTAAAKSIQLKLTNDSDDEDSAELSIDYLARTSTGIISNRRPTVGTPATTSGASTPVVTEEASRLSLLVIAKREAAKRSLYARFFRGPVLGPDDSCTNIDASVAEQSQPQLDQSRVHVPSSANESLKSSNSEGDGKTDKKRKRKEGDSAEVPRAKKSKRSEHITDKEQLRRKKRSKQKERVEGHGEREENEKRQDKGSDEEEKEKKKRERYVEQSHCKSTRLKAGEESQQKDNEGPQGCSGDSSPDARIPVKMDKKPKKRKHRSRTDDADDTQKSESQATAKPGADQSLKEQPDTIPTTGGEEKSDRTEVPPGKRRKKKDSS